MTANDSSKPPAPSLASLGAALELQAKTDRLRRWALKRGIEGDGDDWLTHALIAAALDHPEIREEKRKRGRPRKVRSIAGGTMTPKEREGQDLLQKVHRITSAMAAYGKDVSQAEALRILSKQQGERPGLKRTKDDIRYRASLLSKARRRLAGPKSVANNSAN